MIPKILFRTVPDQTSALQEEWWKTCVDKTPGWEHITYRDGTKLMDPGDWRFTGHLWDQCESGAHKADLIRLEAMYKHGGFYVDSDVELLRPLEPLLHSPFVAGWEDRLNVPNAMFGASMANKLVLDMLNQVISEEGFAQGVWHSGPGVFNQHLKGSDALLLPPGSFYPYHYKEKKEFDQKTLAGRRALQRRLKETPWAYAVHHWTASWKGEGK